MRLIDIKDKLWVLDHVHPESQREGIVLPCVDDVWVGDPGVLRLVIQEVKQILHCHGDCVCPRGVPHGDLDPRGVGEEGGVDGGGGGGGMCDVEETTEEVINKLLENTL